MNIVIDFDGTMCIWELHEDEVLRTIHLLEMDISEELKLAISTLEDRWDKYNERLKRRALIHNHDTGESYQLDDEEYSDLERFPRVEALVADMLKQEKPDWVITLRDNIVHEAYYE